MKAQGFSRYVATGALGVALALAGISGAGAASSQDSADVRVTIQQSAATTGSGVVAYTITAVNRGDGFAGDATITVPYDNSALRLLDVQVSRRGVWVSELRDGAIELKTGRLDSDGGQAVATVRFALQPGASAAGLTEPLAFTWKDRDDGGEGLSNYPAGHPRAAEAAARGLSVSAVGDEITFRGDLFEADEPVFFWYTTPQGVTIETRVKDGYIIDARLVAQDEDEKDSGEFVVANNQGVVSAPLDGSKLLPGTYTMVAQGYESGLTATATFQAR
jgi:hypothetical protein